MSTSEVISQAFARYREEDPESLAGILAELHAAQVGFLDAVKGVRTALRVNLHEAFELVATHRDWKSEAERAKEFQEVLFEALASPLAPGDEASIWTLPVDED